MAGWMRIGRTALLTAAIATILIGSGSIIADARGLRSSRLVAAADIGASVSEASHRFAIPARWIRAVIRVESGGHRRAVSPRRAMGLMQLMPQTWAGLRQRYGLGRDPFDPHDNILAGAAYLREMYDLFGSPGFLAAYNAGPRRYQAFRDHRMRLPAETRAYVARLAPAVAGGRVGGPPREASGGNPLVNAMLFVLHGGTHSESDPPAGGQQPSPTRRQETVADLTAITPRSTGLFVPISATVGLQ